MKHGIAQGGGLRLGEMEIAALLSWGDPSIIENLTADHIEKYPFC